MICIERVIEIHPEITFTINQNVLHYKIKFMKNSKKSITSFLLLTILLLIITCKQDINRSGVVVDSATQQPISGVSVEIYLKNQVKDSLQSKVITDENGRFSIAEKRPSDQMFILEKGGFISHVSTLEKQGDTIRMEKIDNYYKQQ